MDKFLAGKTAFITGGASGMGRAMAESLASAGANIALGSLLRTEATDIKKGELVHLPTMSDMQIVIEELQKIGVQACGYPLDVASTSSTTEIFRQAEKDLGPIDILINAAGMTAEQTVCGHSEELWEKVMAVNSTGVFRMIKLALPAMIERKWGRIINIASTAASVGAITSGVYCASKAAVVALSKCVALEGAAHGVTCNAISPTWVNTKFGNSWMGNIASEQLGKSGEEYISEVKALNPQQRLIEPSEVGVLALYLCREEAQGMTMQDLTLSAGSLW